MTDARMMSRNERRVVSKYMRQEAEQWPNELKLLTPEQWPTHFSGDKPIEIWRSKEFLLQVYVGNGIERLSVNRCRLGRGGNWSEDISWDDLQRLKRECGRGDFDAVEIYPRDADLVNVANMRHLWVMSMPVPFAWRKTKT